MLKESVVAWRSIFVANEVNELAHSFRKISPETMIIWFAFFWIGLGFQWIAQTNPEFSEVDNPLVPFNLFLKFFLTCFVFVLIGIVQYVLYLIITCMKGSEVQKFADLCTLANCSLLLMDSKFHGYYVHGQAPWLQSDLPVAWLKKELDRERAGKSQSRSFGAAQGQLSQ